MEYWSVGIMGKKTKRKNVLSFNEYSIIPFFQYSILLVEWAVKSKKFYRG